MGIMCECVPAGTVGQFPSPAGSAGVLQCQGGVLPGQCSFLADSHCKSHSQAALVC